MNHPTLESADNYVPRGLLLQWHITNRCNLRCAHCYQETYEGAESELSDLIEVLRQYEELLGGWRESRPETQIKGHITVTGGEPFVRGDFVESLHEFALRRHSFSFGILTNGVLIQEDIARCLRELRPAYVQVSIEGSRETHDRIRGPGNHEKVLVGIGHLLRAGIPTMISFTAHRQNFREFTEVARLGRHLGVSRVWTDRLVPSGSAKAMEDALMSPGETREYCRLIQAAREEARRSWWNRTEIASHRALQFLNVGGSVYHCTAGDSLLTVMPNGDVYPCRRMPIKAGNVFQSSLKEIYGRSPVLCALRNRAHLAQECGGCCFRHQCRGGLKCLSFAVRGDPFKADPGCWLAHSGRDSMEHTGGRATQAEPSRGLNQVPAGGVGFQSCEQPFCGGI